MTGFILRWVVGALGLWLASRIVPGIHIRGLDTLLLAALLLGLVNAFVRPLVVFLTLPLTLLTLGLFLLVINAVLFWLVSFFLSGFSVHGFMAALGGAIVTGFVSWLASGFIGKAGRIERIRQRS
jgi:putative membrane protein